MHLLSPRQYLTFTKMMANVITFLPNCNIKIAQIIVLTNGNQLISLPNNKILELSKFKEFSDDKGNSKVAHKIEFVFCNNRKHC